MTLGLNILATLGESSISISNALVVILLYFSYHLLSQLESIKRQSSSLQKSTEKLVNSCKEAEKVIQTLSDPEFRRIINDLKKLQIIYVSQQDENGNPPECFTDTFSRFIESSPSMGVDLGSVSEFDSNLEGPVKSKTLSRFMHSSGPNLRPEFGSNSECETNSITDAALDPSKPFNQLP